MALLSIFSKINGQQQVLSSTMPAMPKEKQTTPISLDENSFDEIKMKEQLNISNSSISSAVSSASSVSRLLKRCSSQQQQQQQCCCQLDDCCPILATSTATGSIEDHATTNSILNNSNMQNSNKINKQHCCRIDLQQQQSQQINCVCNGINCNSSSSNTINNINQPQLCNIGKTNDILEYKSSIRGYNMNPKCRSTITSSSTSSSPMPTTSTTCLTITSSSSSCIPSLASPSSSSCTPSATSSSSLTAITTTIKNIDYNKTNVELHDQNRMQYQYYNGDVNNKLPIINNSYNIGNNSLNNSCSSNNINNSNSSSSSCSSNTTAQSSITATATVASTASAIPSSIGHVTASTAVTQKTPNGVNQPQQQQQLPRKTPNDFIFEKYLGEGSFSTVYHAKEVRTKKEVAIKVCEKTHVIREKKQEYVKREREVMHRMSNCPGFVNLYCTFQDESRLYFVMTYAKNGDLLPYINKVGSFDSECTQHYAAELVLACENMHKRGIVHRDLKPENILLDENMHTLIADFGSAKIIDNNRDNIYVTSSSSSSTTTTTPTTLLDGTSTMTSAVASSYPSSSSLAGATILSSSLLSTSASSSSSSSSSSPPTNNSNSNKCSNNIQSSNKYRNNYYQQRLHNDIENEEAQVRTRRRKCSFVGTAQYVSPELLQNGKITPACDLWALGCILYQMISGLPPFRGNTEFLIFKQILNLNLEFPDGFDKNAEDLVRNLLKLKPEERLGAQDKIGCYESIRTHPFFDGINWDAIRLQTPPTIYPYLPGANKEDELRSQYRVPENLEPGLNDKQLTRLLGLGLMGIEMGDKTEPKNKFNLTETEMKNRLEAQKADKWNAFADGELILKKGFVNKRKGLFARKRMLLLLTGPKLVYIDPVAMVKKGEIPWSPELRVEPKNFKIFFVHTPNRTYYLEDPDGYALKWVNAIENVRQQTCSDPNINSSH